MTPRTLMLTVGQACGPLPRPREQRRIDYLLIREALDAELLDMGAVERSLLGRAVCRLAGQYAALAVLAFLRVRRRDVDVILCDNENEALLLAVLLKVTRRRIPLLTLGIAPAAPKKSAFYLLAKVQSHVDLWLTHSSVHADLLVSRHHVLPRKVRVLPFYADTLFFDRAATDLTSGWRPTEKPYVLAVGRQHRDYATLLKAAEGLAVDVVIDAGSTYSNSPDTLTGRPLPSSVHLLSMDAQQLRTAYAFAEAVVVPTFENDFGAGGTSILEGMAMGRAVIATRSAGGGDILSDRRAVVRGPVPRDGRGTFPALYSELSEGREAHGFYVPVGDVQALRDSLRYLLENPEEAAAMGEHGRALVIGGLSLDHFVQRVVAAACDVATARDLLPAPAE